MNQNYHMAKEYIKYCLIFDKNIMNILLINNCIEEECIDFIINLFNWENFSCENKEDLLSKALDNNREMTFLISIIKDYNNNIYQQFIQFLKINCIDYLYKDNIKDQYLVLSDEETKNKIKIKSISDLKDFCMLKLYNVCIILIGNRAQINYLESYTNDKNI